MNKLFKLREKIAAKNKEVDALKKQYNDLKEELILTIQKTGSDVIRSQLATASVVQKDVPSVKDWNAFGAWVYEHQAIHCLQRRVSAPAIREIMERNEDEPPPGVEIVPIFDISLRTRNAN